MLHVSPGSRPARQLACRSINPVRIHEFLMLFRRQNVDFCGAREPYPVGALVVARVQTIGKCLEAGVELLEWTLRR